MFVISDASCVRDSPLPSRLVSGASLVHCAVVHLHLTSRNLSPLRFAHVEPRVGVATWRSSLWLFVVGTCGIVSGCGGQLPSAPVDTNLLTISGHVYAHGTASGEPAIGDVLITVQDGRGVPHTTLSDGTGFYSVAVQAGTISITASKVGYTTRQSNVNLPKVRS